MNTSHTEQDHVMKCFMASRQKPHRRTLRQRISKKIELTVARLRNYLYYRNLGHGHRAAWKKAGETL